MTGGRGDAVRVLCVVDDPATLETTATRLEREREDLAVDGVTTAERALDSLDGVDCVVSAHRPPALDGLELLAAVRADRPDLPFVLYTGNGSEAVASRALRAGATDYVRRESDAGRYGVLAERVARAVGEYRSGRTGTRGGDARREHDGVAGGEREGALVRTNDAVADEGYDVTADEERGVATDGAGDDATDPASDRLTALFENSSNCIVETAFAGGEPVVRAVNPAFEDVFGYDEDDLVGESLDEYVVPASADAEAADINERTRRGEAVEAEVRRQTADGPRDFLLRSVPFENEETTRSYGVYVDITERKRRERELERRSAAMDASMDGIAVADADGAVRYANDAFAEKYGYDAPADLVGTDLWTLYDGDGGLAETARPALSEEGAWRGRATGRRPDGSTFPVEVSLATIADGGTVAVIRDVTERVRREDRLEHQERRIREFASVVSHDLRNPLSVARARADLARETGEDDHFEALESALARMDRIIEDVLMLVRHGEPDRDSEPLNLRDVFETAWANVDTGDATLYGVADHRVRADRSLLLQVVENLFRNAVHHRGDDVTVRVGALEDAIFVEDDGPGIPPDRREEVFQPGHSTAADGTGLGLSIVESIVDAHGWSVTVEEGTDGGARFRITGVERP